MIETVEQLRSALEQQRTLTCVAATELALLGREPDAEQTLVKLRELLAAYAQMPTVTECLQSTVLRKASHPGTFGIALVTGLMLQHVGAECAVFARAHRALFLRLFCELRKPEPGDLVEALRRSMTAEFTVDLTEETQDKILRSWLSPLVAAMCAVAERFALVDDQLALTPVGHRFLLHFIDAEQFLHDVGEAHKRLREAAA